MANELKKVNVSFTAYIEERALEDFLRCVDHHIDWLLDLYDFPEIKEVCNATTIVEE